MTLRQAAAGWGNDGDSSADAHFSGPPLVYIDPETEEVTSVFAYRLDVAREGLGSGDAATVVG